MNNLGGYKSIELVFKDEISLFGVNRRTVTMAKSAGLLLPPHRSGSSLSSTPKKDASGTSYTHKAVIHFSPLVVDKALVSLLDLIQSRGCILIGTTHNGDVRIFGDKDYPLYGNLEEIYGSRPGELHQYTLTLTCVCLHPELTLL